MLCVFFVLEPEVKKDVGAKSGSTGQIIGGGAVGALVTVLLLITAKAVE